MKKSILLFSLFLICFAFLKSQSIAPNFTLKNTEGIPYTLYDELAENKAVVLCFFSMSCGPCSEDVPLIQEIYENNSEDEMTLMAVETFLGTNAEIEAFINENGGEYDGFSTIDNNEIISDEMFDIDFTPQNVVVCPDKSYKKVEVEYIQEVMDNCPEATGINELLSTKKYKFNAITAGENVAINLSAQEAGAINFEIIDMLGNLKIKQKEYANEGENEFVIGNSLFPGYYIVRMLSENMVADVKKFVVY